MNNIDLYKQNNLCNDINLTSFFPHLDIVDEIVSIKSVSGAIPCWELGNETFYAEISYMDSCHVSSDLNKCIEPVPNLSETKYLRNTLRDEDVETAEYNWTPLYNSDQIQINDGTTNKTLKVSMIPSAYLETISFNLDYSE